MQKIDSYTKLSLDRRFNRNVIRDTIAAERVSFFNWLTWDFNFDGLFCARPTHYDLHNLAAGHMKMCLSVIRYQTDAREKQK